MLLRRIARLDFAVMLGLSVANVVGVPAATWMGQHLGWRSTYLAGAVLAAITVLAILAGLLFWVMRRRDRDAEIDLSRGGRADGGDGYDPRYDRRG